MPLGITLAEAEALLLDYGGYTIDRYIPELDCGTAYVPAFLMDVFPVTNRDYGMAVAAGVVLPPTMWEVAPWAQPDAPDVGMSWDEAISYASWVGGRLPTETEWERAASWDSRSQHKRRYPWGDEWDALRSLNAERLLGRRIAGRLDWMESFWSGGRWVHDPPTPALVGAIPGDHSPSGVRMMSGHVWAVS